MAFLLVGSHQLFAGGAQDDHEVAVALVAGLQATKAILHIVQLQALTVHVRTCSVRLYANEWPG